MSRWLLQTATPGQLQISISNARHLAQRKLVATRSNAVASAGLCSIDQVRLQRVEGDQHDLPTKGKDSWTINLFVRVDDELAIDDTRVRAEDGATAWPIHLQVGDGVHFWSRNRDVSGRRNPLDLKPGNARHLRRRRLPYKRACAQRAIEPSDDESTRHWIPGISAASKARFEFHDLEHACSCPKCACCRIHNPDEPPHRDREWAVRSSGTRGRAGARSPCTRRNTNVKEPRRNVSVRD